MLSVQRVAKAAFIEVDGTSVTPTPGHAAICHGPNQVTRMISSRRAAPHQGSGWLTSPTQEAVYMAATEPPINIEPQAALASGLGPYMTEQEIEQDRNCHYDLQSSIGNTFFSLPG